MTVSKLDQPAFARRHPDMICWRVAAIYRCCVRFNKDRNWALEKLREICPEGHRDHMVDVWYSNIESVRQRYLARKAEQEATRAEVIGLEPAQEPDTSLEMAA